MSADSLANILAQRDALDQQIEKLRTQERSGAIIKAKEIITSFNLTARDLGLATRARSTGRGVAPVRFRSPSGEAWSGRGRKPIWLVNLLAKGRTQEEFKV